MKYISFLFIVLFISPDLVAQSDIDLLWVKQAGKENLTEANSIAVAKTGTVYIGGQYNSDIDFGNNISLKGTAKPNSIFLSKYNADGSLVWARTVDSGESAMPTSISIDEIENVYITRYMRGMKTSIFNKYSSNGVLIHSEVLSKPADINISSIIVNEEAVYCGGDFTGTVDFGNGLVFTSKGKRDGFIAKYYRSGGIKWVKIGASMGEDAITSIALDSNENIVVTGFCKLVASPSLSYIEFDNVNLRVYNYSNIFITKYDDYGNVVLAASAGGTSVETITSSLAIDKENNLYICGFFLGDGYFGDTKQVDAEQADMFIAKFDAKGNYLWANTIDGSTKTYSDDGMTSVKVDSNGDAYVCGYYQGNIEVGNGVSFKNHSTEPEYDSFIIKYDGNGKAIWGRNIGGVSGEVAYALDLDHYGNLYLCGTFGGTLKGSDFGNGVNIQNVGFSDLFLAKYGLKEGSDIESNYIIKTNEFSIHPNPAHSTSRISFKTTAPSHTSLTLTDVLGRQTLLKEETLDAGEHNAEINTANFPAGIYVLTLEARGQVFSQKVVIER